MRVTHPSTTVPHIPPVRRESSAADIAATVSALAVLAALGLLVSLVGVAGVVDVSQNCRPADCTPAVAMLGALIAVASPWLALLPVGAWAVLRLARGRRAWWVVLLAVPVCVVLFTGGILLIVIAGGG